LARKVFFQLIFAIKLTDLLCHKRDKTRMLFLRSAKITTVLSLIFWRDLTCLSVISFVYRVIIGCWRHNDVRFPSAAEAAASSAGKIDCRAQPYHFKNVVGLSVYSSHAPSLVIKGALEDCVVMLSVLLLLSGFTQDQTLLALVRWEFAVRHAVLQIHIRSKCWSSDLKKYNCLMFSNG